MERLKKLNEIYKRRLNELNEEQSRQCTEIKNLEKRVKALEPRIREMFSIYDMLRKMDVNLIPLNTGLLRIDYSSRDNEFRLCCNTVINRYIYLRATHNIFGVLTYCTYETEKEFLTAILDNIDDYERSINDLADKFIEREEKVCNEKAKSRTYYVQAVFKVNAVSEDEAIDNMLNCGERTILRVD